MEFVNALKFHWNVTGYLNEGYMIQERNQDVSLWKLIDQDDTVFKCSLGTVGIIFEYRINVP